MRRGTDPSPDKPGNELIYNAAPYLCTAFCIPAEGSSCVDLAEMKKRESERKKKKKKKKILFRFMQSCDDMVEIHRYEIFSRPSSLHAQLI